MSGTRPALLNAGTTTENNLPLNNDAFNSATSLASAYTSLDSQLNATRTTQVTDLTARTLRTAAYADGVMESLFDQWRAAMIGVTNATDRADGLSNTSLAVVVTARAADFPATHEAAMRSMFSWAPQ